MTDHERIPHKLAEGTWYHGRKDADMEFEADRPAFFSADRDGVELFSGRDGHVLEAEIMSVSPCREEHLLAIAEALGLPDVYDEEFSDFPDVSTYLEYPEVRRVLESRGFDSYVGEDGYLWVCVVWNPELIRKVAVGPFAEAEPASLPRSR